MEEYNEFTSYGSISIDLSVCCGNEETEQEDASDLVGTQIPKHALVSKDRCCPVRTTVFSWVDYVCKRIERTVQQIEKELVLRGMAPSALPKESGIKNQQAWKAGLLPRYIHQQEKPDELNKLSYGIEIARLLVEGERITENLRSYFLQFAENCVDILSDTSMVLPITQTFGQPFQKGF